jgi:hypothetical protein
VLEEALDCLLADYQALLIASSICRAKGLNSLADGFEEGSRETHDIIHKIQEHLAVAEVEDILKNERSIPD